MKLKEFRAYVSESVVPKETLQEIIDSREMSLQTLQDIVHWAAWAEDTSFETCPAMGGGVNIEEHVWSMNREHTRVLVTVDKDGMIDETGGVGAVEYLKKNRIRIRGV
ncbi:MAG: hypothetical protein K6G16_08680 [Lachnospiraceae bacterium]|nr:hypothetical protein [Lachnospiraceae bacterium]